MFADVAAEALGAFMFKSVGRALSNASDSGKFSLLKSMERDWQYLMDRIPWARYLGEGGYKSVYEVRNAHLGANEAISVM